MIIYQSKPTIVVKINNEILKIFPDNSSCKEEFDRLNKINEPLLPKENSCDYQMTVVKALSIFNNVLTMEHADGVPLANALPLQNSVAIVGKCLAKFHLKNYEVNGVKSTRIFGDFSIYHIFINSDDRVISTIDPGGNFLVLEDQLEDVARFLFSVTEVFRYQPFTSRKVIKAFINGYLTNKEINFNDLKKVLDLRKDKSIAKYRLQKSTFKARIGNVILFYNRLIILWALKF